MKKVLPERGLMIKLSELYELIQDNKPIIKQRERGISAALNALMRSSTPLYCVGGPRNMKMKSSEIFHRRRHSALSNRLGVKIFSSRQCGIKQPPNLFSRKLLDTVWASADPMSFSRARK